MKILNSYAGVGGNRKLWGNGHEITAVEYSQDIADIYKKNFPNDDLFIGDAHNYLLVFFDDFDFIWSSPPCQSHSKMVKATKHDIRKYPDLSLYQEIIWLDNFHKGLWVVENVKPYYEPLIKPTAIIGRHIFWSNFKIHENITLPEYPNFINTCNTEGAGNLKKWLGINYDGNVYYEGNHDPCQVLRNAVHPEIGLHILKEAEAAFSDRNVKQGLLFE